MRKKTFLAAITVALTLAASGAFAQTAATMPSADQPHPTMQPTANRGAMMNPGHDMMSQGQGNMAICGDMAAMHEAMKQKMTAMDAKLDGLVMTMNEAKGQAKVDAMAAVINELVSQRKAMRDDLMSMQPMMMGRMMGQMMGCMMGRMMGGMRQGAMGGMSEGMHGCGGQSGAMHRSRTMGQPSGTHSNG